MKVLKGFRLIILAAAFVFSSVSVVGAAGKADVSKDLAKARQATAKYHDINKAIEDGYVEGSPNVPGMGYHYVKPTLIDEHVNVATPEALLYVPSGNGLKLVGVEYISTMPNSLYGEEFDPPHGPIPFTLHAWV